MDTRTSIETIIALDAESCPDVSVSIRRSAPTVTIRDPHGERQDVFLRGDDADEFIKAFDLLVKKAPEETLANVLKHLALPYVESAWACVKVA